MEIIKHNTCLYVIDNIYLDPASKNLYNLFLHCDYCGKPIKLCIRTENDIVNWLGGKKDDNKGKWYEYLDKGLLKSRHGNHVVYDVDYLLDNLAREVNIMESARRQKG